MGINNLGNKVSTGSELRASDINQFHDALNEDLVGRDTGVPTRGKNLGNDQFPWDTVFTQNINYQGNVLDLSDLQKRRYAIIDGPTMANSEQANFITTQGRPGPRDFVIKGSIRPIRLLINGRDVVINRDINFTVPSSLVDSTSIANTKLGVQFQGNATRTTNNDYLYLNDGLDETATAFNGGMKDVLFQHKTSKIVFGRIPLTVATILGAGAAPTIFRDKREQILTARRLVCLSFGDTVGGTVTSDRKDTNSREFFLGRFEKRGNAYTLYDLKRRYMLLNGQTLGASKNIFTMSSFASPLTEIDYSIINSSSVEGFTFHDLVWVFIEAQTTNVFLTNREPLYSTTRDSQRVAQTGAFFDLQEGTWSIRTSGTNIGNLVRRDVIPIGVIACPYYDDSDRRSRSRFARTFDFTREYSSKNTINIRKLEDGKYTSTEQRNQISVYGRTFELGPLNFDFDESAVQNRLATHFYITEKGVATTSNVIPVYREELRGYYHPTESWRCVGHSVKGNRPIGFSAKYSNTEKYKDQYRFVVRLTGNFGTGNDLVLTQELDTNIFGSTFFFQRPVSGNYGLVQITMNPNNLFSGSTDLVKNVAIEVRGLVDTTTTPGGDGLHGQIDLNVDMAVQGKPRRSDQAIFIDVFRSEKRGQEPQILPIKRETTGEIVVIVNRAGLDRAEKRRWDELST